MKTLIIINGPSGVGKSSVSALICKKHGYKHCDADEFKLLFSNKRSQERTDIGNFMAYTYTKELIKRGYSIIVEADFKNYLNKLTPLLKKSNYRVFKILLYANIEFCIKNNSKRKRKGYEEAVIREVYEKLCLDEGDKINVSGKSTNEVYNIIQKKYLNF